MSHLVVYCMYSTVPGFPGLVVSEIANSSAFRELCTNKASPPPLLFLSTLSAEKPAIFSLAESSANL